MEAGRIKWWWCLKCGRMFTEEHPTLTSVGCRHDIHPVARDTIAGTRILTMRAGLRLEIAGMRRRGRSMYSLIKHQFGFRGNKERVLVQLNDWIKENLDGA